MKQVVHLIPIDGIGGVEIAARSMQSSSNRGINFHVEYLYPRSEPGGVCRWLKRNALMFRKIGQAYRTNPDILIVSLWRACMVGLLLKVLKPRMCLVVMLHCPRDVHAADFVVTRLAILFAREVWADSRATMNRRAPTMTAGKGRVISMITRRLVANAARSVTPTFIYWGRIEKDKRVDRVIRFFAEVYKRFFSAHLWIVGPDGGALEQSRELCTMLGLSSVVTFAGAMGHARLMRYASRASFYVQASDYEGMALAVVESMQLGLVPVVTPVGEVACYCQDGVNAVILRNEMQAAQDVMDLLLNDDRYQRLRARAITTWQDKSLYSEDMLVACGHLLGLDSFSDGSPLPG